MKRITKTIMAFLTAMTMTMGAMGVTAYAEEDSSGKTYTLEQLFAMSDEEFFALEGRHGSGKDYYNEIKTDAEKVTKVFDLVAYGGISGNLSRMFSYDENGYVKGETENEIKNVLGDTVKYNIDSPSFSGEYYSNILSVNFPDYLLPAEETEITDKQVKEFAKCYFCVNQVYEISYDLFGSAISPAPNPISKVTLLGDVDLNGVKDLADLTTVAKYNLNNELYPLVNETAFANADMNDDGIVDGLDTSALIENQLGKK